MLNVVVGICLVCSIYNSGKVQLIKMNHYYKICCTLHSLTDVIVEYCVIQLLYSFVVYKYFRICIFFSFYLCQCVNKLIMVKVHLSLYIACSSDTPSHTEALSRF